MAIGTFQKVGTYANVTSAMADFANGLDHELSATDVEHFFGSGVKKVRELSRQARDANKDFYINFLKDNHRKYPVVDCISVDEDGNPINVWGPADVPPSYRDTFFASAESKKLFHIMYRNFHQIFFLSEEKEDLTEILGLEEPWIHGRLENSRDDIVYSAFVTDVKKTGRIGHLKSGNYGGERKTDKKFVLGELNCFQNKGEKHRVPTITIHDYPREGGKSTDSSQEDKQIAASESSKLIAASEDQVIVPKGRKPIIITPYKQIEAALHGAQTMQEKHGWERFEMDTEKYKDAIVAAFDAYIKETGYKHPVVFWHLPRDRSK